MKVIIVDDEKLVRISLKSMLTELNLPLEIVGEATNGEEMVALVAKHAPDVVFVDIKMPKLNGLAGIKASQDISPNTQWIILTGFPEFDYAKQAVKLKVADYLLKPVSPEQLAEVLQRVKEQSSKTIWNLNKEFESDVIALFHGLSTLPNEGENSIFLKARFKAALFFIDSQLEEKSKAVRQLKFCQALRQYILELLDYETRFALFSMPNGDLAILSAWGFNLKGKEIVETFFLKVSRLIEEYRDEKFSITLFQSDECLLFKDLVAQLTLFETLAPLRTVLGISKKISGQELDECGKDKYLKELANIIVELDHSYREANYPAFIKSLRAFEKMVASIGPYFGKINKPVSEFLRCVMGTKITQGQEIKTLLESLAEYGEHLLETQTENKYIDSDMVEKVIAYIDHNYMYDIGISQIAEKLAVTPNYLSTLFHKKTGKGFMKYLTEIRMIKAKELLANPNFQVQQVAEEVGYYSARHFTKLFTQFMGCYPSEYRKRFEKNN